jgi:hypothetical protein
LARSRAIAITVLSNFKGLRRPVKRYSFSPNFKGLGWKRKLCRPVSQRCRNISLWSRPAGIRERISQDRQSGRGHLDPETLAARGDFVTASLDANPSPLFHIARLGPGHAADEQYRDPEPLQFSAELDHRAPYISPNLP